MFPTELKSWGVVWDVRMITAVIMSAIIIVFCRAMFHLLLRNTFPVAIAQISAAIRDNARSDCANESPKVSAVVVTAFLIIAFAGLGGAADLTHANCPGESSLLVSLGWQGVGSDARHVPV